MAGAFKSTRLSNIIIIFIWSKYTLLCTTVTAIYWSDSIVLTYPHLFLLKFKNIARHDLEFDILAGPKVHHLYRVDLKSETIFQCWRSDISFMIGLKLFLYNVLLQIANCNSILDCTRSLSKYSRKQIWEIMESLRLTMIQNYIRYICDFRKMKLL